MIPMLAWFVFIILIALLAWLAVKFVTLRVILALILTLPILISITYCVLRRSPVTDTNRGEFFKSLNVVSDRGETKGNAHENTIAAFKQAKNAGADTIRMDIRMTKDGMLIVYKDAYVADYDNVTYEIEETHWAQLAKISVYGSKNSTILTFDEAVSWCQKNDINMLWHLPSFCGDLFTYLRNKIMQDGLYSRVAVTTYNFISALRLRFCDSKLLIGFIWKSTEMSMVNGNPVGSIWTQWMWSTLDSLNYWSVRSLLLTNFIGIDFIMTSVVDADKSLISDYAANKATTLVYELTTQAEKAYFSTQLNLPYMCSDLQFLKLNSTK